MVDIQQVWNVKYFRFESVLNIKYRFKKYQYLVADKYGNFFILPHCPLLRSIRFKQLKPFLNGKTKSIKYHQNNISLKSLRLNYKEVEEKYVI